MKKSYNPTFNSNSSNKPYKKGYLKGKDHTFFVLPNIDVRSILDKIFNGLWRIFIFFKYLIHGLLLDSNGGKTIRLPWVKIGVAAFIVFVMLGKDVNFSVNMKAPLSAAFAKTESTTISEFGIASPVALFSKKVVPQANKNTPTDIEVKQYVNRFLKVAEVEHRKFGMPVSVKLAQAILESGAGRSQMAKKDNNHFGRPLSGKHYQSAWENWRAHSLYIQDEFSGLLVKNLDYMEWSVALKKVGYNNDNKYAEKLIHIIEKYDLNQYD